MLRLKVIEISEAALSMLNPSQNSADSDDEADSDNVDSS
jgi:hypothetical protein